MHRRLPRVLLAVCVLGLSPGGLSDGAAWAGPPPIRTVPWTANDEGRSVVADDPSIIGGRPVRVDAWSPGGSADVIRLHFALGSPGCSAVHAEVRETVDAVTVDLLGGTHPDAVGRMCTMVVVPAALDVTLGSPVGGRTVLSAT